MDCRAIDPVEVKRLERVMESRLRRWRSHPDFEELLGMARLEFWRDMSRADAEIWKDRERIMNHNCRQVAYRFMHDPTNRTRAENYHHRPVPRQLSIDEIAARLARTNAPYSWETMLDAGGSDNWQRRVEPDFVPELLERLWRQEVWNAVQETLSADEALQMRDWLTGAVVFGRAGRHDYVRLQRVLNRYRERIGLPLKYNGSFGARREPLSMTKEAIWQREHYARNREARREKRRRIYQERKQQVQNATGRPHSRAEEGAPSTGTAAR